MLQVTNSQTFEERGFVMLASLEAAEDAIFDKLTEQARALRSNYFAALNEIAAKYKKREQELTPQED
jgi:hypothetical protein